MPLTTQETQVGIIPTGTIPQSLVVSSDSRHFACVVQQNGKMCVAHDGNRQRDYQGIRRGTPIFSPDGQRIAYIGQEDGKEVVVVDGVEGPPYEAVVENTLCFSPDSRKFAYVGFRDKEMVAVVDGVESESFPYIFPGPALFSPDSQRVAFVGWRDEKAVVIVDGQAQEFYDAVRADTPIFSPDSQRVAYVAHRGGEFVPQSRRSTQQGLAAVYGGNALVVCDGVAHREYDEIIGAPRFSPDGQHLTYTAARDGRAFMVVDGKESEGYDAIGVEMPVFSPDGQRIAYIIQSKGKGAVVVDGVTSGLYDAIGTGTPVFSPDSQHIAFVAQKGWKSALVFDGTEGEAKYRFIQKHTLAFSPNSQRMAYAARPGLVGVKGTVVVDGKQGPVYPALGLSAPIFSADSSRVAYMAGAGWNKAFAVVDGQEGLPCNQFMEGSLAFSPDGSYVVYEAKIKGRAAVVVDGIAGQEGTAIFPQEGSLLNSSEIVFDNSHAFHTLTFRPDGGVYVLEVDVTGATTRGFESLP